MGNVLVTGATGFLGYHLVKLLQEKHERIYLICRKESQELVYIKKNKSVSVILGDLYDWKNIVALCDNIQFETIYHCAWEGASGLERENYIVQNRNITLCCNVVELARALKCKQVVVTGTVCERQCDEIAKTPRYVKSAFYLQAKRTAYEMCKNLSILYGVTLIWCHFYHPIGSYNKTNQIIANTIQRLLQNDRIEVGSGQGAFDVISAKDLVNGMWHAAQAGLESGCYYIGSGRPRRLFEYLDEIYEILECKGEIIYGARMEVELPMFWEWLDSTKFSSLTGFEATSTFQEGVVETLNWIENMKDYQHNKWNI